MAGTSAIIIIVHGDRSKYPDYRGVSSFQSVPIREVPLSSIKLHNYDFQNYYFSSNLMLDLATRYLQAR